MISLHFTNHPVVNFETAKAGDNSHFKNYFHGMLSSGVYLPPSAFESYFLNDAISYQDLDHSIPLRMMRRDAMAHTDFAQIFRN